jgi:hypothetical protein
MKSDSMLEIFAGLEKLQWDKEMWDRNRGITTAKRFVDSRVIRRRQV